jgi:hypothetical protein
MRKERIISVPEELGNKSPARAEWTSTPAISEWDVVTSARWCESRPHDRQISIALYVYTNAAEVGYTQSTMSLATVLLMEVKCATKRFLS